MTCSNRWLCAGQPGSVRQTTQSIHSWCRNREEWGRVHHARTPSSKKAVQCFFSAMTSQWAVTQRSLYCSKSHAQLCTKGAQLISGKQCHCPHEPGQARKREKKKVARKNHIRAASAAQTNAADAAIRGKNSYTWLQRTKGSVNVTEVQCLQTIFGQEYKNSFSLSFHFFHTLTRTIGMP